MSSRLLSGRYELLEKIGDGGMAVVYKGKDRLLNRFIASKILRPEFTKDATFVENFKRESQAAAGGGGNHRYQPQLHLPDRKTGAAEAAKSPGNIKEMDIFPIVCYTE